MAETPTWPGNCFAEVANNIVKPAIAAIRVPQTKPSSNISQIITKVVVYVPSAHEIRSYAVVRDAFQGHIENATLKRGFRLWSRTRCRRKIYV